MQTTRENLATGELRRVLHTAASSPTVSVLRLSVLTASVACAFEKLRLSWPVSSRVGQHAAIEIATEHSVTTRLKDSPGSERQKVPATRPVEGRQQTGPSTRRTYRSTPASGPLPSPPDCPRSEVIRAIMLDDSPCLLHGM